MKYITTDKHPELKEGIIMHFESNGESWYSETRLYSYKLNQFEYAKEQGYIKEVEEKEFTKSEMIEFLIDVYCDISIETGNELLNNWLTQRNYEIHNNR